MSVDGAGRLNVFWPKTGDVPESVEPTGEHVLEGSVFLDDAPGPEVFIGVFGVERVSDALEQVRSAWDEEGVNGLERLARENMNVAVVVLRRLQQTDEPK